MRRHLLIAMAVVLLVAGGPASGAGSEEPLGPCGNGLRSCGVAAGSGIDIGIERPEPGTPQLGQTPAGGGTQPASTPPPLVTYIPACQGNLPGISDALCSAATTVCPEVGDMQYWRFLSPAGTGLEGPFTRAPGAVCLGPTEVPTPDPRAEIAAVVERDWQTFGLLAGELVKRPAAETLVNVETLFASATPATFTVTQSILGQQVVLTATGQSWAWDFGDGASVTTSQPEVSHVYAEAGDLTASVAVTYSGTYTIGADPTVLTVTGTATVPGPALVVPVREARVQLEGG